MEQRRAQLRGLYLSLLVELAGLYEERKEYGSAIEALRTGWWRSSRRTKRRTWGSSCACTPSRGGGGRRWGQYERLREVLSGEFGAQPEAASIRLQGEIWAGTFPSADSPPAGLPLRESLLPLREPLRGITCPLCAPAS